MQPESVAGQLIDRLNRKQSLIGIVGLGYVGLPLLLRFHEVGYRVLGIAIDASKVDRLNRGESYIEHISSEAIAAARAGFPSTAHTDSTDSSRKVPQGPGTSVESADDTARSSCPPITPIKEDSLEGVRNPNPNLCKSVESVDRTPGLASLTAPIICVNL